MNMAMSLSEPRAAFTLAQVAAARSESERSGRRVIELLEEQSGVEPGDFARRLAVTFRYPLLSLRDFDSLEPAFDVFSYTEAIQRDCAVFRTESRVLLWVVGDPFDGEIATVADERSAGTVEWAHAHRADIGAFLARYEETVHAMDAALATAGAGAADSSHVEDLSLKTIAEDKSGAVRLVHSTIFDALRAGASDIHLESVANGLVIKYRLDGVLNTVGVVEGSAFAEQIISRVKIMAELDIAERRIPQDGRFKVKVKGREIDFRVSVMPSIFGEDSVLRILDRQHFTDAIRGLRLEYLGFSGPAIVSLRRLAAEPHGMLLVTGPTGSGKTTTLYALLSEINTGQDKIITIEDPVEYQLPGVLQIPVNDKKGLGFARGLRSILRHDPDKIMVGEIRDQETAQIALQSALTGHLVFTTVHANNAFDVIGRFLHMGVDPYSFVSALNGVVAQRLVRLACPACSRPHAPDATLLAESGLSAEQAGPFRFRQGAGCGQCRGSGYKGRRAIAEVLNLNDEIRELIVERAPLRRIKEAAGRTGMTTLRQAALDLVREGQTSLAEINRVTAIE
jgi:general secretion pathway protein E